MLLRSMLAAAAITAFSFAPVAGPALAQDAEADADALLLEDDVDADVAADADADVATDAEVAAEADVDAEASVATGGRTFGFRTPGGCGEFKYWDGATCLDARDKTPEQK